MCTKLHNLIQHMTNNVRSIESNIQCRWYLGDMNMPCVPFFGMSSTFSLIEPSLPLVLLIALPLMDCLILLLKIGRTLRGKVSHISTLEALDVSIIFILAHHLGILSLHWMPCLSTPSCFLILHHQVTTIFMIDLDLLLGCLLLLNLWLWLRLHLLLHQLLGWAH